MSKLQQIKQVQALLLEAQSILRELKAEMQAKELDTSNKDDLPDIYIRWALRDITDVQTKLDYAVENLERRASKQ